MEKERRSERKHLLYYFEVIDCNTNTPAGRVVDITTEGLMLVSENILKQKEVYSLKLKLPEEIKTDVELTFKAKCMWSKGADNKDLFDSGFLFLDLTDENREIINNLIRWFRFSVSDEK